jgi:hypothetical protein
MGPVLHDRRPLPKISSQKLYIIFYSVIRYFCKTFVMIIFLMKCNLMLVYLIKYMHTRKENRAKQVYVADGKNEIINFAILIV